MKKPRLLFATDHSALLAELAEPLNSHFEIYFCETWEQLKETLNSDYQAVFCHDEWSDRPPLEVMQWCKSQYPQCLRGLISEAETDVKKELIPSLVQKMLLIPATPAQILIYAHEIQGYLKLLQEKQQFQQLSITDSVTQLTNHRFFQEKLRIELKKAQRQSTPLSLVMIDVDRFKLLNDQFGHPVGDKVLYGLSQLLLSLLPPGASLSRYGGEEFGLILPRTTQEAAVRLCEQLRTNVASHPFEQTRISISLGLVSFPNDGRDADELIALSDQALYSAKRQGRNMTIVAKDINH